MIKKLTKGIEESNKEKENLLAEKEKLLSIFKEVEQKAFTVQEDYKKIQEVVPLFHIEMDIIRLCKLLRLCLQISVLFSNVFVFMIF